MQTHSGTTKIEKWMNIVVAVAVLSIKHVCDVYILTRI